MGHYYKSYIRGESLETLHYELFASLIEMRGRLVEEDDRALKKKASRDINSLFLSRGEAHSLLPYPRVEPFRERVHEISQSEVVQEFEHLII